MSLVTSNPLPRAWIELERAVRAAFAAEAVGGDDVEDGISM